MPRKKTIQCNHGALTQLSSSLISNTASSFSFFLSSHFNSTVAGLYLNSLENNCNYCELAINNCNNNK